MGATAGVSGSPQLDLEFTGRGTFAGQAMFDGTTYRQSLDYRRLTNNLQRVLYLLLDGEWHSLVELRAIAPSADSRVRDLRKARYGAFAIDTIRESELTPDGSPALYYYRLRLPNAASVRSLMEGPEERQGQPERMAS